MDVHEVPGCIVSRPSQIQSSPSRRINLCWFWNHWSSHQKTTCGEINMNTINTIIDGQRNNMESLLVPFMFFSEIKFEKMRTESKPLVTSERLEHFEYQTESNMNTFPPPKQKKHQMGWWHHPKDFAFCSCLVLLFLCVGFCAQIGFAFC